MRGKNYVLALVTVALAGLAVWTVSTPAVAGLVFGDAAYRAAYTVPIWAHFGLPLLALPPLVAGFALPKGFLLWGVAAPLVYVPGSIWLMLRAGPEAVFRAADPGVGELLGLVFVNLSMLLVLTVACTVAAAIGSAARLLLWRLRGESIARRLGVSRGPGAS